MGMRTRRLAIFVLSIKRRPFPRHFGNHFLIPHTNHIQTTFWSADHPQTVLRKKSLPCIFLSSNQLAVTNLANTHKQPTTNSQSLLQEADIQPLPITHSQTNKSHLKWVAAAPRPPTASPSTATFAPCAPDLRIVASQDQPKRSSQKACSGATQTAPTPKRSTHRLAVGSAAFQNNARKERAGHAPIWDGRKTRLRTGADPRAVAVPDHGRIPGPAAPQGRYVRQEYNPHVFNRDFTNLGWSEEWSD